MTLNVNKRKWQPIESAPRNYTSILLTNYTDDFQFVGYWHDGNWRLWGFDCVLDLNDDEMPTHWMPLPDMPKEEE